MILKVIEEEEENALITLKKEKCLTRAKWVRSTKLKYTSSVNRFILLLHLSMVEPYCYYICPWLVQHGLV